MQRITPFLWFDQNAEVMQAMLQMEKIDIQRLREAYEKEPVA